MGGTVATLEQTGAGGIQIQHCLVLHNGELNLIQRAVFRQPGLMIFCGQTIGHGFFNDFLAVRHGVQGTVQTISLDRECTVFGNITLPRQGLGALKQLVKGAGGKPAHHQQNALTEPAADVCTGQTGLIGGKVNPAVFRTDVFHLHVTQLVAYQPFQTEQAGNAQFKFQSLSPYLSSLKNSSK